MGRRRLHRPPHRLDHPAPRSRPRHRPPQRRRPRFQILPRRWVVERSFAWLLRSRRLVRDYERRTVTSEAVILWSITMLMSRRLAAQRRQRPAPARAT
ncbi:transposase [Streptomyces sporangiiformans]|uniref:transposase n=1 Tax=Streptomyces sporangiiformans TaxID=2315329 RepID=UPI0030B8EB54